MMAYISVTKAILPEFLSSGFIGLTASLEPDEDVQTRTFPDVMASHHPMLLEGAVILELEPFPKEEAKDEALQMLDIIKNLISIK